MKQVLDNDLDPFEHRELVDELKQVIAQAGDPHERRLAESLLAYTQSRELQLAAQPNRAERLVEDLRSALANRPAKWVLKAILLLGFGLIGANAVAKLVGLIGLVMQGLLHTGLSQVTQIVVVSGKALYVVDNAPLLLATTVLVMVTGALALLALILLATGRDVLGLRIGTLALIFSLCIVNFLTFYFLQLYALLEAVGQVFLLVVASLYRWRFLDAPSRRLPN
jgi:hypothetical protein